MFIDFLHSDDFYRCVFEAIDDFSMINCFEKLGTESQLNDSKNLQKGSMIFKSSYISCHWAAKAVIKKDFYLSLNYTKTHIKGKIEDCQGSKVQI